MMEVYLDRRTSLAFYRFKDSENLGGRILRKMMTVSLVLKIIKSNSTIVNWGHVKQYAEFHPEGCAELIQDPYILTDANLERSTTVLYSDMIRIIRDEVKETMYERAFIQSQVTRFCCFMLWGGRHAVFSHAGTWISCSWTWFSFH